MVEVTHRFLHSFESTRCKLDEGADGVPEGVVVRSPDRSAIAKIRREDYDRTLKRRKKLPRVRMKAGSESSRPFSLNVTVFCEPSGLPSVIDQSPVVGCPDAYILHLVFCPKEQSRAAEFFPPNSGFSLRFIVAQ